MQVEQEHKFKVDKKELTALLLSDSEPTKAQLKELSKVITIVMIKHHSKYLFERPDLESFAILAVLERRKSYDPSFSAYSYIYTICRNEIGNRIKKLTKELFVEDILPISNASTNQVEILEIPSEIRKFTKYLTGEKQFQVLEIKQQDAINLAAYILMHTYRPKKVPEFILKDPHKVEVLYKLLNLL